MVPPRGPEYSARWSDSLAMSGSPSPRWLRSFSWFRGLELTRTRDLDLEPIPVEKGLDLHSDP